MSNHEFLPMGYPEQNLVKRLMLLFSSSEELFQATLISIPQKSFSVQCCGCLQVLTCFQGTFESHLLAGGNTMLCHPQAVF